MYLWCHSLTTITDNIKYMQTKNNITPLKTQTLRTLLERYYISILFSNVLSIIMYRALRYFLNGEYGYERRICKVLKTGKMTLGLDFMWERGILYVSY